MSWRLVFQTASKSNIILQTVKYSLILKCILKNPNTNYILSFWETSKELRLIYVSFKDKYKDLITMSLNKFLGTCDLLIFAKISWGPIEIIKFNILAFISVSTELKKKLGSFWLGF